MFHDRLIQTVDKASVWVSDTLVLLENSVPHPDVLGAIIGETETTYDLLIYGWTQEPILGWAMGKHEGNPT